MAKSRSKNSIRERRRPRSSARLLCRTDSVRGSYATRASCRRAGGLGSPCRRRIRRSASIAALPEKPAATGFAIAIRALLASAAMTTFAGLGGMPTSTRDISIYRRVRTSGKPRKSGQGGGPVRQATWRIWISPSMESGLTFLRASSHEQAARLVDSAARRTKDPVELQAVHVPQHFAISTASRSSTSRCRRGTGGSTAASTTTSGVSKCRRSPALLLLHDWPSPTRSAASVGAITLRPVDDLENVKLRPFAAKIALLDFGDLAHPCLGWTAISRP
jgi:hypothetical protein